MTDKKKTLKSKKTEDEIVRVQPSNESEKVITLSVGDTLVISTRFQVPEEAKDVSRLLDDGAFIYTSDGPDIPAKRYRIIQSGTFALRSRDDSRTIRIVIDRPINTECMVIV